MTIFLIVIYFLLLAFTQMISYRQGVWHNFMHSLLKRQLDLNFSNKRLFRSTHDEFIKMYDDLPQHKPIFKFWSSIWDLIGEEEKKFPFRRNKK